MADWNLAYDYVAVFLLLLVLVWYMTEKRVPLKSHKVFLMLVGAIFVAAGSEISATHIARNIGSFNDDLLYMAINIENFSAVLSVIIMAYYILQLGHLSMASARKANKFFDFLVIATILSAIINYFTRDAFVFEDGRFQVKAVGAAQYVCCIMVVASCVIIIMINARGMNFMRSSALIFNLVSGVIACYVQLRYYQPMINFMMSAVCLTLYYYLQNPVNVTDSLTQQFNRKFMGEYVNGLYETKQEFNVIIVAMDDFKFINKTYGADNGDNLLYQVGRFLESVKANKQVFRFGSDQFCIVINKNLDKTESVAENVLARFKHPWYSQSQMSIMMSASIGIVECPNDATDYRNLIEVLDYSMSVAKKTSKGKITKAGSVNLDRIQEDKAVEKAVKQAMDRDDIQVYYQPIYSVNKGVYSSAEALVRLHDEGLGWISPEIFIPISEKNGLIIEMGEMVLTKVCRFIRDFKLSETTVEYIEVNISPIQLMQRNFAERMKEIMDEYGVQPEQINIEITETATMTSSTMVMENIDKLISYGISFSLDDYGSGNANIDYINHMPFKIIKLDKYIIWDSFKNTKAGITLEYTIGMLNALQLYIVAEGVETEEMKDRLADIGCHYMQGWYYSKAVSDNDFIKLIETQQAG